MQAAYIAAVALLARSMNGPLHGAFVTKTLHVIIVVHRNRMTSDAPFYYCLHLGLRSNVQSFPEFCRPGARAKSMNTQKAVLPKLPENSLPLQFASLRMDVPKLESARHALQIHAIISTGIQLVQVHL